MYRFLVLYSLWLWQPTHDSFKSHQSHGIRRERPQKTGDKAPPVSSPPTFLVDRSRSVLPVAESSLAVAQCPTHGIGHQTLLDDVGRVRQDPENLGGDTSSPEVDHGGGEVGVLIEPDGEEIVGSPPEEKE